MRRSRKGMKSGMKDFEAKTSPRQKMDTESWFIECYRNNQGHPLRTLVHLYKGNYHKFVLAVICFLQSMPASGYCRSLRPISSMM